MAAAKLSKLPFPKSILLAAIGLVLSITFVMDSAKTPPRPLPVRQAAKAPYLHSVSGTGLIESAEENINVAPYTSGKVLRVWVQEGQWVEKGSPLYQLDPETLQAEVAILRAQQAAQKASLEKLRHEPRSEDIPPLQAQVNQLDAQYQDALLRYQRLTQVRDPRAISQDDLSQKKYTQLSLQAQLQKAQADLKKLKAGAWRFDLQKAEADLQTTTAQLGKATIALQQAIVRAPRSGEVLKVNIRPGESLGTVLNQEAVVLGNTKTLQVRVDIDEINASQVYPNMEAVATLRGDSQKHFPLRFNRIVPYMVPKKNLSGSNTERVDVRVLQLIYQFDPPHFPVYVGQQVDIYLKSNSGKSDHAGKSER